MIIDFQAHFFRIEYVRYFEGRKDYPKLVREGDKHVLYHGKGFAYALQDRSSDFDLRIRHMDEAGVDMQVLTAGPPGVYHLEKALGVRVAREQHDYMAEIISKYPGRFTGLASLPLQDIKESIAELDRAVGQLGLRGLQVHSNIAGKPLDSQEFWPVYERVQELDVPLYIHPTYPLMGEAMTEYGLISKVGYMFDTSLAVLRLIFSGALEKFPRLKVIHPHMGAAITFLMERIDQGRTLGSVHPDAAIPKSPREYYDRVFTDSACHGKRAFKFGYEFFGPDRILFASDYPFFMPKPAIDMVNEMDISEAAKKKIFSENARSLLKI